MKDGKSVTSIETKPNLNNPNYVICICLVAHKTENSLEDNFLLARTKITNIQMISLQTDIMSQIWVRPSMPVEDANENKYTFISQINQLRHIKYFSPL
jgi:hypothetical protein